MNFTIDEILDGTTLGLPQSAGRMRVLPLCGDDDDALAPPTLRISTQRYGSVCLRNDDDRPTVVPPGAGWVVKEAAQDHAVGGGAIIPGKSERVIDTARCIQQTQGGLIAEDVHTMLILPAALRTAALAMRKEQGYNLLWQAIVEFNTSRGVTRKGTGHLCYFLEDFARELDQFVAEFELIPRQIGAIIAIDDRVVGVERAPSAAFWRALWLPLVRICYGSLALPPARNPAHQGISGEITASSEGAEAASGAAGAPPLAPLTVGAVALTELSLAGIRRGLAEAEAREVAASQATRREIADHVVKAARADESHDGLALVTVASAELSGQVLSLGERRDRRVRYASLCARAA